MATPIESLLKRLLCNPSLAEVLVHLPDIPDKDLYALLAKMESHLSDPNCIDHVEWALGLATIRQEVIIRGLKNGSA